MTWVCPEWDIPTLIAKARAYGYQGVELRVECKHRHGVELEAAPDHLKWVKASFADAHVELPCLAISQRFSSPDTQERKAQVDRTKRYVELAATLGVSSLRVFGGRLSPGISRELARQYIAEALREVAEFADSQNVNIALETHDDWGRSKDVVTVIETARHPRVKCVWDILHPVSHGESLAETFEQLKSHVVHCHIHDGIKKNGNWDTALLGEGSIDHCEVMRLLRSIDFDGHLSGEFINYLPPDVVLPQYANKLREYEKKVYG